MAVEKTKKNGFGRLLTVIFVLFLIVYIGFQIYRSVFDRVKTEMATAYSVYESIETTGIAIRSETLIPTVASEGVYYAVENGTRVAKDGVIASVYPEDESGRIEEEIRQIDREISLLKSIQTDSGSLLTLDSVNTQLIKTVERLSSSTNDGIFDTLDDMKYDLISSLSKKQAVTGNTPNFSARLSALQEEKTALQGKYRSPSSSVKAPVAGYFANKTDGFETVLKTDGLDTVTVDELQGYMDTDLAPSTSSCGKIVGGYEWYFGCIVPDSYYNSLAVGTAMSLKMAFVTDKEIPVTVYACNKNNNGQLAVIFRCATMSSELAAIRKETVKIQLVKHAGLKVPKKAIYVDEQMRPGVYIRSGNVVCFRLIEQDYSEPADYVISAVNEKSGYLHLYDDIIVEGKNLYDGRIIR